MSTTSSTSSCRRSSTAPATGTTTCPPGSDFSIKELFDATIAALPEVELDGDVEVRPRSEDDAYTILLDPSRINQDFGWSPKVPLEEGVRRAIEYYREHGVSQTYTHLKVAE